MQHIIVILVTATHDGFGTDLVMETMPPALQIWPLWLTMRML